MNINIYYGTESGNAELLAEDLANELAATHSNVTVTDLQDVDPATLDTTALTLIVCSTHGEGGLPNSALPFAEKFDAALPDLTGMRYAVFGLGDTFYDSTYSQGSEQLDRRFTTQGATRIGPYGRHDASSFDVPKDLGITWLTEVLATA